MNSNKPKSKLEEIAIRLTEGVGSVTSIVIHTILFVVIFGLKFFGVALDNILLILTTAVSLEAIYLAIFIQMTVNRNTESLEAVEEDIDDIQEDVEGLEKDIDDIQEDVDEITEDISEDDVVDQKQAATLEGIEQSLKRIVAEIEELKRK